MLVTLKFEVLAPDLECGTASQIKCHCSGKIITIGSTSQFFGGIDHYLIKPFATVIHYDFMGTI